MSPASITLSAPRSSRFFSLQSFSFNKQRFRTNILLVGPLHSPKSDLNSFEIMYIAQTLKDFKIKVWLNIKTLFAAVTKLQVERKIIIGFCFNNFDHNYLKGSILKICRPVTANCQSAINS